MPFTLRSSPSSPFVRKVNVAAAVLGISDQITLEVAVTKNLEPSLLSQNPLGKIPALVLEDGRVLYDSRVIMDYLNTVAGGSIIPEDTDEKFNALTLAALADGIMEAALLVVYEGRYRPDQKPYAPWLDMQREKIRRGLTSLETALPSVDPVTVGTIGLGCALEYIDFRGQFDWRDDYPNLLGWLGEFSAAVPVFKDSSPA
ncbi:MAG: glutathione S-transferase [Rhodospirillaceae bacterium]|jgi:glutathione S-transferase|nr:glutathione S-transferase [Rhodospirillaceae bacterium]MBT7488057.1 glutathione S-transferase [Rhodospirillales bacterium]MBT4699533.1 glutathione S-transferase [Rhodospirillaceae bacterium]MBT5035509.1 glutathione S-transferase [Rhodospirillaceae bacterium]MBT6219293.1 glutathione S-transferase [Rhodospirillaceae bacterium]